LDDRIGQRFAQRGLEIEFASIGNPELYDEAYDKFSDRRASSPYPNNTICSSFGLVLSSSLCGQCPT
jgi:hypothetical protein